MGTTKRKRNRKKQNIENFRGDPSKIIDLQKSMGIKCPKVKAHYFNDTGWGMKSKVNIQEDDVLIALPLCHLITPNMECDIFKIIKRENLSPQCVLSVFLMYEAHLRDESKHFNYINILPKSYTNLYFCTEEEVQCLPNFFREELLSQRLTLKKNFILLSSITNGKICNHCGETLRKIITSEKFAWAWFTVNTRSVYYQDENNLKSMALAPLLDMFNHSNDADTKMIIDFKNSLYVLKTLTKYRKFNQVFIKYGAHSNLKLLLEYGFILPNNENDFIEFTLDEIIKCAETIDEDFGMLSQLKQNFIQSNKLNKILTKSKDGFSWNFKGLVSVLITKDKDLFQLQSKMYSNNFTDAEKALIQKIEDAVATQKLIELKDNLKLMEKVKKYSVSFLLAKNLVEIYLSILH